MLQIRNKLELDPVKSMFKGLYVNPSEFLLRGSSFSKMSKWKFRFLIKQLSLNQSLNKNHLSTLVASSGKALVVVRCSRKGLGGNDTRKMLGAELFSLT